MWNDKLGLSIVARFSRSSRNLPFFFVGTFFLLAHLFIPDVLYYWMRIVLSPIIYGRSYYQSKFLLLSICILFLFAPCAEIFQVRENLRKLAAHIFSGGVILLFTLQIITQMYVAGELELPKTTSFLLVKDGFSSSSSIAHIHTGKSVLTFLLKLFTHSETLSDGDVGLPFYHFLGPIVSVGYTSLFLLTLISFLLLVVSSLQVAHLARLEIFLFIVTGLIVLKSTIDGGIFSKGSLLFGCICLYVAYIDPRNANRPTLLQVLPRLVAISMSLSLFLSASFFFDRLDYEDSLAQVLYFSIVIALPPILLVYAVLLPKNVIFGSNKILSSILCLVILTLWSRSVLASSTWREEHKYKETRIPVGASLHYFANSRATTLSTEITGTVMTMGDFYRHHNLRPGIRNVTISSVGERCRKELNFSFDVRLIEGNLRQMETPDWLHLTLSPCQHSQWCTFRVYGTLRNCAPSQPAFHAPTLMLLNEHGASLFAVRNFAYRGEDAEGEL